jgi:hypothetical protein
MESDDAIGHDKTTVGAKPSAITGGDLSAVTGGDNEMAKLLNGEQGLPSLVSYQEHLAKPPGSR